MVQVDTMNDAMCDGELNKRISYGDGGDGWKALVGWMENRQTNSLLNSKDSSVQHVH